MNRVALFATCLSDFAAPGPARAAFNVLTALGYDVEVPKKQSCCGQPALNTGYPDEAARLVRAWRQTFTGYDAVVAVGGSCAAMLTHHGPELINDELPRVWEFSQFVCAHPGELKLALDATVTYHDSCHMTRMLGERSTPRELLSRIQGVTLVEMVDSDVCCGFGGTFSVKFPEVSTTMASMKLATIADTDADYVVSSDSGCMTHLRARAEATGHPVTFLHLAEITWLAMNQEARS